MILSPQLPRAQSLPTASEGAALPRAWLAAGGGEGWGDVSCSRGQGGWSAALLELAERAAGAQLAMGGLKEELLKTIWHAFTALDLDRSGKVSKSQLKVLSHNLCTVLNVPHDPVALEEHFRDDDEGPVSNQGYMPYLNKFILEKVQGNFDKVEFNRMCWTLCFKKNLTKSPLFISDEDAFKVWVIFNFLSEDKYPLVIVPEEIEYLLKKLTEAMGAGSHQEQFEHNKNSLGANQGLSAWELIELIGSGQFSKGMDRQTISMAVNEVFNELILDVLKQGYMLKKGHRRKNWTERWFVLKPNIISYYASEDLKDKKGDIILDENCFVESLPDKDGKKCLFLIKCLDKSFEISASDKKKKQEWIQAIQTTVNLLRVGSPPPHKEARQKRKELRQKLQAEQEELERQMKELQIANENKQEELETVRKQLEEAAARAAVEEKKRLQTQMELQDRFSVELAREKMVRQQMEEQVAQKSSELKQYLQRVCELEEMYKKLQEALEDEKQARQDEETVRKLQARLLEEESAKRAELEKWHLQQQQTILMTEAEKQELETQRIIKERALQVAMQQLEQLELERKQALEQYEGVKKKLELAANKTKSWKDKVAHHEGLIRLIEPGSKNPHLITNWGPAAFTEAELEQREKSWKGKKATSE
ncbi:switch-associated protein 70 [Malaclemys terrapin pileata]|uniref:switch-associated protein 70 n=1 Tax=Malaclemys terrapin pileata TaxID=2991368 RepID=UPI0023A7FA5C|nr:switch-associated protein 70 [Malaclemys terrapin pileata]